MKRTHLHGSRSGGALLISLMATTLVASLGAMMVRVHMAHSRRQATSIDSKRAFYVAEAGLAEASLALACGKSGNVGDPGVPASFGEGVFWVEAEQNGDYVDLRSTGLVGSGRSCLEMTLQRDVNLVASLGIFAESSLTVGAGSHIDGFDSRLGSYEEQLVGRETSVGSGAKIGSNADVILEGGLDGVGSTRVEGEARPGPGGVVVQEPGVVVTGPTNPSPQEAQLPAIDVPEVEMRGAQSVTRELAIGNEQAGYQSLRAAAGSTLEITGPATVVIGDLVLEPGARLLLDTSQGDIGLYVIGDLDLAEGSLMEYAEGSDRPVALMIASNMVAREEARAAALEYDRSAGLLDTVGDVLTGVTSTVGGLLSSISSTSTSDSVTSTSDSDTSSLDSVRALENSILFRETAPMLTLRASGEFKGMIYAPLASLELPAALRIFGSVAAHELSLEEGSRFSYDSALLEQAGAMAALPRMIGWRVVDLPSDPLVRSRLDPIVQLRLRGVTPLPAPAAAPEDHIAIRYKDGMGMTNDYAGPIATFDSRRVVQVLGQKFYANGDPVPDPSNLPPPATRAPDASSLLGLLVATGRLALSTVGGLLSIGG